VSVNILKQLLVLLAAIATCVGQAEALRFAKWLEKVGRSREKLAKES